MFISDRGSYSNIGGTRYKDEVFQDDIFIVNIKNKKIKRLTDTPFNESYHLMNADGNMLAFISDESGINNIYLSGFENDVLVGIVPITNVSTGITQLSWNGDNSQLVFTGFRKSGYDIYLLSNPIDLMQSPKQIPFAQWIENNIVDVFQRWLPFVEVRDISIINLNDLNQVTIDIKFNIQRAPNSTESVQVTFDGASDGSTTSNGAY